MNDYLKILATIKRCPKTFQSNYVRNNAAMVAEAASRGHLTALNTKGQNSGCWELTALGTSFLNMHGGCV